MGKQQSKDVIQYINISNITPSELNPRKTVDEESLNELAQNIKEQGILQPITVRNNPLVGLEIVCGERRYRAAKVAGLDTVPCIVRDMTDDEAFDVMIAENLQRKDVEPLEEAAAFRQLVEKRGYDVESLCQRFGKSEKYIRIRLKLNELIEPFKELLVNDTIKIGHASEIAKVSAEMQEKLYADKFSHTHESWWYCPTVSEIKRMLTNRFRAIGKAVFNTDECKVCAQNTGCNILFSDAEDAYCTNASCYSKKHVDHLVSEAVRIAEEEPGTIIVCSYYQTDSETSTIIERLKEKGVEVKDQHAYSYDYDSPDEPEEPEMPNREDYEDEEDYQEAVQDYQEELRDYQEEVAQYPAKLAAYRKKIEQGDVLKAFHINCYNVGKYDYYKAESGSTAAKDTATGAVESLRAKDRRNAEIKHEKTVEEAKKLLESSDYLTKTGELTSEEVFVLRVLMLKEGEAEVKEKYEVDGYRCDEEKLFEVVENFSEADVNLVMRSFIREELLNSFQYETYMHHLLLRVARNQYPEQLKEIEDTHQATYLKRKNGIERKLEQLAAADEESEATA